jgi:stress-induced morphogen
MGRRITKETRQIEEILEKQFPHHPRAYPPAAYKYNSACIRVRIVDPKFEGLSFFERHDQGEEIIRTLPEKAQSSIFFIALLAPSELETSPLNYEFEHPSPEPRFRAVTANGNRSPKANSRRRRQRGVRS